MSYPHLPRARIINGRLMSEPSLEPPEDPPEGNPVADYDDFDDFDDGYPKALDIDCEYWSKTL